MAKASSQSTGKGTQARICGLIMPISGMPGYEVNHWSEVRNILERAISAADFTPRPVWEGVDSDIIHDRIMANLYQNPIAVCDVSGLNPNVMLELGIRLSFGKATIIVTDDFDTLPFDTKMIEHLGYPRDLHLFKTESFIEDLKNKIISIDAAVTDNKYRPFIKNFSHVEAGVIPAETRSIDEVLLERVERLGAEVRALRRSSLVNKPPQEANYTRLFRNYWEDSDPKDIVRNFKIQVAEADVGKVTQLLDGASVTIDSTQPGILRVNFPPWLTLAQIAESFMKLRDAGIEAQIVS